MTSRVTNATVLVILCLCTVSGWSQQELDYASPIAVNARHWVPIGKSILCPSKAGLFVYDTANRSLIMFEHPHTFTSTQDSIRKGDLNAIAALHLDSSGTSLPYNTVYMVFASRTGKVVFACGEKAREFHSDDIARLGQFHTVMESVRYPITPEQIFDVCDCDDEQYLINASAGTLSSQIVVDSRLAVVSLNGPKPYACHCTKRVKLQESTRQNVRGIIYSARAIGSTVAVFDLSHDSTRNLTWLATTEGIYAVHDSMMRKGSEVLGIRPITMDLDVRPDMLRVHVQDAWTVNENELKATLYDLDLRVHAATIVYKDNGQFTFDFHFRNERDDIPLLPSGIYTVCLEGTTHRGIRTFEVR